MKAPDFLRKGIEVLAEKGSTYESGETENSMQEIVNLHAIITPDTEPLTELQGWYVMMSLKLVRLRKSIEQGKATTDHIVDLINYAAKMGEHLFPDAPQEPKHPECLSGYGPLKGFEGPMQSIACPHNDTFTLVDKDDYLVTVCDGCGQEMTACEFVCVIPKVTI